MLSVVYGRFLTLEVLPLAVWLSGSVLICECRWLLLSKEILLLLSLMLRCRWIFMLFLMTHILDHSIKENFVFVNIYIEADVETEIRVLLLAQRLWLRWLGGCLNWICRITLRQRIQFLSICFIFLTGYKVNAIFLVEKSSRFSRVSVFNGISFFLLLAR